MIKRLLEFEDDVIFIRVEVIDVIEIVEVSNGDFILYMLVQDSFFGFEVLKFIQNMLFFGKVMFGKKNKKNEIVFFFVWEIDLRNVVKIFLIGL